MAENELLMERPLAMRLLHEAQIASAPVGGLVTAGSTIDRYFPGDWPSAREAALAQGCRPWAIFAFAPGQFDEPRARDFATQPDLRRITVSLETKGVLQLRVYRCVGGKVDECPLRIID